MKLLLNEDLFDDIMGIEIPEVELEEPIVTETEIEPEGPELGLDTGISNLIHELIIEENQAIQSYNNAAANMEEYPELVEIMHNIASEEFAHIGELQKALEMISPNASNIVNGEQEVELEEALAPSFPLYYDIVFNDFRDRLKAEGIDISLQETIDFIWDMIELLDAYNMTVDEFFEEIMPNYQEDIEELKQLSISDEPENVAEVEETLNIIEEAYGKSAVKVDDVINQCEQFSEDMNLPQDNFAKETRKNYITQVYYTYARELKPVGHIEKDGKKYVYSNPDKNEYKLNLKYINSALNGNLASWFANEIKTNSTAPSDWRSKTIKYIEDEFLKHYEVL